MNILYEWFPWKFLFMKTKSFLYQLQAKGHSYATGENSCQLHITYTMQLWFKKNSWLPFCLWSFCLFSTASRRGALDTTFCDVSCDRSMVYSVSSTNKTDRHDITEVLLKVALNTMPIHVNHPRLDTMNTQNKKVTLNTIDQTKAPTFF